MILLIAILAGMAGGWLLARWQHRSWTLPPLHGAWLVILAFLPQFLSFYLPATRTRIPGPWVSAGLLGSQIILLVFCWLNLRLSGTWLMTMGLALNFLVIAANGGFMPISPQTAGHLAPQEVVESIPLGSRLGYSKDVLLDPAQTHLEWLSDRLVLPAGIPYRSAFSLGDVVIAAGAFWLITTQGQPLRITGTNSKETECYLSKPTNPPSL